MKWEIATKSLKFVALGNKRVYFECHRIYKAYKLSVAKNSARYYEANEDK